MKNNEINHFFNDFNILKLYHMDLSYTETRNEQKFEKKTIKIDHY